MFDESELTIDGLLDIATVINSGARLSSKPPEVAYFIATVQDMLDNQNYSGEYTIKDYTRWFDNQTLIDEAVGFIEMTQNRTIAFTPSPFIQNKLIVEIR